MGRKKSKGWGEFSSLSDKRGCGEEGNKLISLLKKQESNSKEKEGRSRKRGHWLHRRSFKITQEENSRLQKISNRRIDRSKQRDNTKSSYEIVSVSKAWFSLCKDSRISMVARNCKREKKFIFKWNWANKYNCNTCR